MEYTFMQTVSGSKFYIGKLDQEVVFDDIAWALAKQCRYAGHIKKHLFYSVAEHSVHVAEWCYSTAMEVGFSHEEAKRLAWNALMHDATEAFLSDIVRPQKQRLTEYYKVEKETHLILARQFDLWEDMHDMIKEADNCILLDERAQIMNHNGVEWEVPGEPLGIQLECLMPHYAANRFIEAGKMFSHVPLY